jgi:predicted permease
MSRWRAFFQKKRLDREVDEEMRLHIEMEAEELRSRGLSPETAKREALVAFGGVERYKEAHRDERGVRWLEESLLDIRYAARALIKSPAFTLSSVLVLALGIGASTTVFGAINAVLLSRLPYPHDEQLVEVDLWNAMANTWHMSVVDYRALEAGQHSFSAVGAEAPHDVAVQVGGTDAVRQTLGYVTAGVFRALDVQAAKGRVIEPSDERLGAPPVAVVSARFAAQAGLGASITLDGIPHTIVGILPPGVTRLGRLSGDIWPALQLEPPTRRGPFFLIGIARLANGVTLDAATRDLAGVSQRLFPLWTASFQDRSARVVPSPLRERVLGDASKTLGVFGGAVALVLLVAVANVASLALVRATNRERELTVRAMLGGTRARIARLLVTESLLMAGAGAIAGLVVGILGFRILIAIGPYVPRLAQAKPDAAMLGFAVAIAIVVGLIVGAAPVFVLSRSHDAGSRVVGAARGAHAARAGFVIAQFALTLPLLAGAGLLLNSFVRLLRVQPGFDPRGLVAVQVSLPVARYGNDTVIAAYWARALPLVRDVSGVLDAGLVEIVPPRESDINLNNFALTDRPELPSGAQPVAPWISATSEYFRTLRVPLLQGRLFTPADSASVPDVIVVSRTWANRYYPDGSAVGRQLREGGCTTCTPATIIGVVGDIKIQGLDEPADAMYVPPAQGWPRRMNVVARTAGPPAEATKRVVAALRTIDAGVPLDQATALEDRVYESVVQPRHWAILLGGFAGVALILAAVGIFGLLSYNVSTRRREIGVRMALGARAGAVTNMFVWRGMGHALIGAGIGLALTVWSTRALASALFDVRATDPLTLAAVTLVLLVVALTASWLPARRAAAVAPVTALRLD